MLPRFSIHKGEFSTWGIVFQKPLLQIYFHKWRIWFDWHK